MIKLSIIAKVILKKFKSYQQERVENTIPI